MRFHRPTGKVGLGLALIGVLVVMAIGFSIVSITHVQNITCTVTDKDRTTKTDENGNSSSDMRVYTEDCGTLSVSDDLWSGHFSSSDTYASIKVDSTYEFKTRGFRIPFFSMFPKIIEVHKAN